ncbi:hypothetical protein PPERSA_07609 [Pseudocohnilembus persalinus]|uniref:Sperm-tail PG-rich repeat n=1 Tax=Pseudocohnilembus persalinus TaxID=266149 RepID=A0A0V0QIE4_PSEPJ|nr:hypothetical protein PPERSA_07609 [Pseudocohnilembus persalinus]|eukprot:KRX01964.1 hypothetical protein PPERSA_07609 [Pseudocohnilembus persalinus]
MAFVYQSERKPTHIQKPTTDVNVGPGAYYQYDYKEDIIENLASFNTNAPREQRMNKDQLLVPGPGAYNIAQNNLNEKIVRSSNNEDIKIIEVPNPQSQFKSQSKRFQHGKDKNPGPGQYEALEQFKRQQKLYPKSFHNTEQSIMRKLEEKYTKTPSIPSKIHQNGYIQKDDQLQLIKGNQQNYTGIKQDVVGPGEYQAFDQFKQNKGTERWAKNAEERFKYNHRQTQSVGPGAYDLQSSITPLYQLKQGASFASKTMRISEQRKGMIANQFLKQKSMANTSIASSRTRDQTEFDDSDSEYEYIDDTTPGPGYYHNESVLSSIKPQTKKQKFQFFGTGSLRFKEQGKQYTQAGPGAYHGSEISSFQRAKQEQKYRKPPFHSSNTRFEIRRIQEKKPGPASYDPRVTLQDKLIDKVQKGYRGNFGTTDQRFKPEGMDEYPGPGSYLDPIQERDELGGQTMANFKSKTVRGENLSKENKNEKQTVQEAYLNDYYDISRKIHKDDEIDTDLKVPRPAFGSSVKDRFQGPKLEKKQDDDDDDDYEYYTKDTQKIIDREIGRTKQWRQKPKPEVRFGVKAERFNYKQNGDAPGPGKYFQAQENTFDIKTFNVKFTPII